MAPRHYTKLRTTCELDPSAIAIWCSQALPSLPPPDNTSPSPCSLMTPKEIEKVPVRLQSPFPHTQGLVHLL